MSGPEPYYMQWVEPNEGSFAMFWNHVDHPEMPRVFEEGEVSGLAFDDPDQAYIILMWMAEKLKARTPWVGS